jgi:hypothetical protein
MKALYSGKCFDGREQADWLDGSNSIEFGGKARHRVVLCLW